MGRVELLHMALYNILHPSWLSKSSLVQLELVCVEDTLHLVELLLVNLSRHEAVLLFHLVPLILVLDVAASDHGSHTGSFEVSFHFSLERIGISGSVLIASRHHLRRSLVELVPILIE